jgi:hypothetical protein
MFNYSYQKADFKISFAKVIAKFLIEISLFISLLALLYHLFLFGFFVE